jgi:hypothetical protein
MILIKTNHPCLMVGCHNDPHELDDLTEADYDVDECYPEGRSGDQDWVIEFKFLSWGISL